MTEFSAAPVPVSLCISLILLLTVRYRKNRALRMAGTCLIPLARSSVSRQILMVLICLLIPVIMLFRDFGLAVNTVLCAVGVLGCELACRDYVHAKSGGLYEHGIITENGFLPFSEIISIPVVTWDDYDPGTDDSVSIELITQKNGTVRIPFDSTAQRRTVTEKILELIPRLRG